MIQSISTQTTQSTEKQLNKRESEGSPFTEALQLQANVVLSAMLDPSATASLPGAGTALVEADPARQDVSELAARELVSGRDRQGARDRGTDAASHARQTLSERSESQASPAPGDTEGFKPQASERADQRLEADPGRASDPAPVREQAEVKPSAGGSAPSSGATGGMQQTSPNAQTTQQQNQQAAGGINTAATNTNTQSANTAASGGNASAVTGVSQSAGAGAKGSSPTMLDGQSSGSVRAGDRAKAKSVIRHEPRAFEAQLQRGLAQVLRQKGGTLNLKLDPVDLGTVKVSLKMAQGRVEGSIEASSERARGLLHEHLDTLKSSLEQRGITVDRLDVRLAGAAESGRQFGAGQEAGHELNQQNADAGGDRQSGSFRGEDRQAGNQGGMPGERTDDGLGGVEPTSDDWTVQGGTAEPLGGWLRLDTVA